MKIALALLRCLRIRHLRRMQRRHQDDIDHYNGTVAVGRRQLAGWMLTIRDREARLEAVNRELMQLESTRSLIAGAVGGR